VRTAIDRFTDLTKICVFSNLKEEEVDSNRVINFNSRRVRDLNQKNGNQYGQGAIVVRNFPLPLDPVQPGTVGAAYPSDDYPRSTPGHILGLYLDLGHWLVLMLQPDRASELVMNVVHELGHCINLPHHASREAYLKEWKQLRPDCALPHGRYSGNWLCPMRYRKPIAFAEEVGDQVYRFFQWDAEGKVLQEVPEGQIRPQSPYRFDTYELGPLCSSSDATGKNQLEHAAGSSGHKGCLHYLQVKDDPGSRPAAPAG
jgi:hypothetical protein